MSRAVCPGTFDPVTHGHLDVVARAARLFDEVVVAVGVNAAKAARQRLFTDDERIAMLQRACADLPGVRVVGFEGLLTDLCAAEDAAVVVKGLRSAADLEYETPMASMNAHLSTSDPGDPGDPGGAGRVDTVFLVTDPRWSFVSSSLVKEVAGLGGDVSGLVPDFVHDALRDRLGQRAG